MTLARETLPAWILPYLKAEREAAIEECARLAESANLIWYPPGDVNRMAAAAAAAIRALKD